MATFHWLLGIPYEEVTIDAAGNVNVELIDLRQEICPEIGQARAVMEQAHEVRGRAGRGNVLGLASSLQSHNELEIHYTDAAGEEQVETMDMLQRLGLNPHTTASGRLSMEGFANVLDSATLAHLTGMRTVYYIYPFARTITQGVFAEWNPEFAQRFVNEHENRDRSIVRGEGFGDTLTDDQIRSAVESADSFMRGDDFGGMVIRGAFVAGAEAPAEGEETGPAGGVDLGATADGGEAIDPQQALLEMTTGLLSAQGIVLEQGALTDAAAMAHLARGLAGLPDYLTTAIQTHLRIRRQQANLPADLPTTEARRDERAFCLFQTKDILGNTANLLGNADRDNSVSFLAQAGETHSNNRRMLTRFAERFRFLSACIGNRDTTHQITGPGGNRGRIRTQTLCALAIRPILCCNIWH